jgi:3,4-dihydroxy 2-butanone 4-phosphate synthase/GTP cyclohydrolase II
MAAKNRNGRARVVARADLPTTFGHFKIFGIEGARGEEAVAIQHGRISRKAPLVRVHSQCLTGDVFTSQRCDCRAQLEFSLRKIAKEPAGIVLYLPQEGRGIGLIEKIRAYNLQDKGLDTVEANTALGYRADPRDYGIGLQILKDLGLSRVRLLTNNPKKTDAFVYYGYDLQVVDQVPIIAPEVEERRRYLDAKRDKMGHLLPSHAGVDNGAGST